MLPKIDVCILGITMNKELILLMDFKKISLKNAMLFSINCIIEIIQQLYNMFRTFLRKRTVLRVICLSVIIFYFGIF